MESVMSVRTGTDRMAGPNLHNPQINVPMATLTSTEAVLPTVALAALDNDGQSPSSQASQTTSPFVVDPADPMNFGRHRRDPSKKQIKLAHPEANKRKIHKYYTRQNNPIDQFLGAEDEERAIVEEDVRYKPKIKFAVTVSFFCNCFLFVIQLYAAIATGSLSVRCLLGLRLFATAADAIMYLVTSSVIPTTSRMAARPSVYKYPVGRTRIETLGIILFCALMTSLHPAPVLAKSALMVYCLFYRRFPTVRIFFVDHRNAIVVNIFGLIMSIAGDRFVWYLDPVGAIMIALLILFSWCPTPSSKCGSWSAKNQCRAYLAGQHYYVEIDVVMDEDLSLKITHDVAQSQQRKLEGLANVERAFVHIDYEHAHDPHDEHKPLYEKNRPSWTLKEVLLFRKSGIRRAMESAEQDSANQDSTGRQ
ncbi:hypothetical protein B0T22DRAFT_521714 [Podospora appendiculata]|uniref:Cation efflux protein cytoplasmic domain-containing protein n=1 Tax=Podospora appendiculata TaxID=314037 RepID=A0AAE1C829_9PEZI|nr:hypothetical protein B0T22DRAFT_521714 [Podospora appendiculata]